MGTRGGDDVLEVKFVEHVQDLIRPTDFLFGSEAKELLLSAARYSHGRCVWCRRTYSKPNRSL